MTRKRSSSAFTQPLLLVSALLLLRSKHKGELQFECNDARIFLAGFEACMRAIDADVNCYLCFTWQDPSGILPEEVYLSPGKAGVEVSNIHLVSWVHGRYWLPDS